MNSVDGPHADRRSLAQMMARMTMLLVAAISAIESLPANAEPMQALHGLNNTSYFVHQSPSLGRPFHIYVKVPENLERGDTKLPVIYLLDGGETFPILAAYSHYLTFFEEMPEAIFVGISYGTDNPAKGNMRVTDFTAPAEGRSDYGGAAKFLSMLETELIPQIERDYPADPARRHLVGMSLAGQFALFAALETPTLFHGVVAVNPALHRNLPYFTAALDRMPQPNGKRSNLYVVSTSDDEPNFRGPALEWIAAARAIKPRVWCLHIDQIEGEGHLSGLPRAFRNAMRWMHGSKPKCEL